MKEIVKGIVTRLKAAASVTTHVSDRTYLDVPQGATFPFISLDISSDERYTKTSRSVQYQIVFNAWSRQKTPLEALNVLAGIKTAIDRQESLITLDSGTVVMIHMVSEDCYKDPDGVTWHAVGIYNAYVDFGG